MDFHQPIGSNTWQWVEPLGATNLCTLPAKAACETGKTNSAPRRRRNRCPRYGEAVRTFEWDESKNAANAAEHALTFEEATDVFSDLLSITVPDPDHSVVEQRFATIGMTKSGMVVVVIHADADDAIRIISARVATPTERRDYEST